MNNTFHGQPYSYQPSYNPYANRLQTLEQQMTPRVQNQPGIIWVSGLEGAKAFALPPNTSVVLMDSEDARFYIKMTDASGMPSLRSFVFEEYSPAQQQASADGFVSRVEFEELRTNFNLLLNKLGEVENDG